MPLDPDERVRRWASYHVREHVPGDSRYLHYRDCPDLVVDSVGYKTSLLSDVTLDPETVITAVWGCAHGPERMTSHLHRFGDLPEILEELVGDQAGRLAEDMETVQPFFAAHYPAPGGTCYVPDER